MGAARVLEAERSALCETLETVGPDGPTLCEGWLVADLAAHLIIIDTRPDGLPGVAMGGPLGRHTERLTDRAKERGFEWMLERLRSGPPRLYRLGPLATAMAYENWVHHEDVRRAAGSAPRPDEPEIDAILWRMTGIEGRLGVRRVRGAGIEIEDAYGRHKVLSKAEPRVTISGPTGEVALYVSGRKEAADVTLDGPPEAVALVTAARFGL